MSENSNRNYIHGDLNFENYVNEIENNFNFLKDWLNDSTKVNLNCTPTNWDFIT